MLNRYNGKTFQLATAFMVALARVVEERKDELKGRLVVPVGGEQVGVQIGDKYVTYRKTNSRRVAEVVAERDDDIPFTEVESVDKFAKLHWIRSGHKYDIAEKDRILSVSDGEKQSRLFDLKASETFYAVSEAENNEILYGNDKLKRAGLLTVDGKRSYSLGVDLATATGEQVVDALVAAREEFVNSSQIKGTYEARTLVIDNTLYSKLLKSYGTQEYKSRLKVIEELGIFENIVVIKNFKNPVTSKPTMLILDNVPDNFQVIIVQEATADEWEIGRTTYVPVEEKLSEVLAFRPKSIMELITA